jgi:hypothetical protein
MEMGKKDESVPLEHIDVVNGFGRLWPAGSRDGGPRCGPGRCCGFFLR